MDSIWKIYHLNLELNYSLIGRLKLIVEILILTNHHSYFSVADLLFLFHSKAILKKRSQDNNQAAVTSYLDVFVAAVVHKPKKCNQ